MILEETKPRIRLEKGYKTIPKNELEFPLQALKSNGIAACYQLDLLNTGGYLLVAK